MRVYALVGKSGTGKSYQAMNLCRDMDIEAIIDDGLLIYGNSILAGISAKRQKTKAGAIKTALFTEDEHRDSVVEKLRRVDPASILVLGTSDRMIERIVKRLELPSPERTVYIEEITTEKERQHADKQRHELGKHVIPVPTFQLKREFSGYFVDPLRIFRSLGTRDTYLEKSVVRPTYSYMGGFFISDNAISDIVTILAREVKGVDSILRVKTETGKHGVSISVLAIMEYGCRIVDVAREYQRMIEEKVSEMTAFNVATVDIEVRGLKT